MKTMKCNPIYNKVHNPSCRYVMNFAALVAEIRSSMKKGMAQFGVTVCASAMRKRTSE